MVDNPHDPSDPSPAIEAAIAAIDALTNDQQKSWPDSLSALVSLGSLRALRQQLASLRPHPSPPPDAGQIEAIRDAIKLLEQLTGPCEEEDNGHNWRACRRCSAVHGVEDRFPVTMRLLLAAIDRLRVSPPDAPPQAIAALIARWRREAAPHVNASGDEAEIAHAKLRCADELNALAASPRPSPAGTREEKGTEG